MDWGTGTYERIALQLLPAARVAIDRAAPARGERVIDVGCGTGNASLLAAERGARVTGIDPAQRLLDVAVAEAAARGLDAAFTRGEAGALPLADAVAEVVVSVFGVIFAPDAQIAAGELARVSTPGGRIVLSTWIPSGALFAVMRVRREALASATGAPAGPPPFAWHDADALAGLFAPLGYSLEMHEEHLAFSASSPAEFFASELRDHPLWISSRAVLEQHGQWEIVHDRALEIYESGNEEVNGGFRVTSGYRVATLVRG